MTDNEKYITKLQDGELAVKTIAQTGDIIPEEGKDPSKYTTALVQTSDGPQLCQKVIDLSGGGGGGGYVLPTATAERLGGIKVGQNLSVEADGTLNATGGSAPSNAYTRENLVAGDGIEFNPVDPEVIIKNMTRYDYATINNALAFGSTPFSVEAHVKTPASGHYGAILGPSTVNYPCFQFGFDNNNRVYFNAAPDAYSPVGIIETKSDPLSFNTEYWVKAEYTGTRYNLYVGTTKNNMQVVNYVDSAYVMTTNLYNIGTYVQWSQHDTWTGEIWLSELKVTINNVVVFDGSDSSQYTIVGNPTIVTNSEKTKIDIASSGKYSVWSTHNLRFNKYSYYTQFDTSKYVQANSAWGLHSANTWELVIHYRTPSSLNGQFTGCVVATHSNSHPGINLACNYSNLFLSLGSPDSGSWLYDSSICSVSTSTDYWVRMTYGTSADTYVVTNATDSNFTENVNTQTFTSAYKVDFQEQARFGAYVVSGMSSWGDGRIYISDCYVKADGQYVFNGADNTQYSVVGSPLLVTGVKQQVFIDNAWLYVN